MTTSYTSLAESLNARIEDAVNTVFDPLARHVSDVVFAKVSVFGHPFPWIVAWLVLAGVVFTAYFGFVQFRRFRTAVRLVRGDYSDPTHPGEVHHFQALATAVSGTVGLGNIAGVAVAVTVGGPGATFWMIVAGVFGMATKFVECTLGVRYRVVHADGSVSGGPMYYLTQGLAERGLPRLGKVLAVLSAATMVFFALFGGNMFQSNQSYAQLVTVTGGSGGWLAGPAGALVFGVVLAALVGMVLLGGIRSIARLTSRLVPLMAGLYLLACLIVLVANIGAVPGAVSSIVEGAFSPKGVAGGALGVLAVGFQRAAFSNEAGLGSAPIAHSTVKTNHPATEGLVALLEPFIDTVVVCTATALTIVVASTPSWERARAAVAAGEESPGGVTLTSDAFASVMPWFPHVLTVAVLLFAFSTIITWSYYGLKGWTFLFGHGRTSEWAYKALFTLTVVLGSLLTLGAVLDLADALVFCLAVFNIVGLYFLAPVVRRELSSFLAYLREHHHE